VGDAVAADPAGEDASQRPAAAGADDQDVAGLARDGGEDGAGLAALDDRDDGQVSRELPPGGGQRVVQPLPGVLAPDAAQVGIGTLPVGDVAARRYPGMDGY
jgi:hypothetical protein